MVHLQVAVLITACTLQSGAWRAALGRADLAGKSVMRVRRG
jgi:hypothetical protein